MMSLNELMSRALALDQPGLSVRKKAKCYQSTARTAAAHAQQRSGKELLQPLHQRAACSFQIEFQLEKSTHQQLSDAELNN